MTTIHALSQSTSGLNASINGRGRPAQGAQKPAPVLDLPALQNASRVLHDQLTKDAQVIPDLGEMMSIRTLL